MSAKIEGGAKDCSAGTALGLQSFTADIVSILAHIDRAFHPTRETRDRAFAIGIEIDTRAFAS
jgi:hypothetical protein